MAKERKLLETKKQGMCFRCKKEKEILLFTTSAVKVDGKLVATGESWVCHDCLGPAVNERPRVIRC